MKISLSKTGRYRMRHRCSGRFLYTDRQKGLTFNTGVTLMQADKYTGCSNKMLPAKSRLPCCWIISVTGAGIEAVGACLVWYFGISWSWGQYQSSVLPIGYVLMFVAVGFGGLACAYSLWLKRNELKNLM